MVEDDRTGVKPMYRNREWNAEERQVDKTKKRSNWWNTVKSKTQYKTVLFVTPTPGGHLMKELQKREAELNKDNQDRIKIVEKGGLKIKIFYVPKILSKNLGVNKRHDHCVQKVSLLMSVQKK